MQQYNTLILNAPEFSGKLINQLTKHFNNNTIHGFPNDPVELSENKSVEIITNTLKSYFKSSDPTYLYSAAILILALETMHQQKILQGRKPLKRLDKIASISLFREACGSVIM